VETFSTTPKAREYASTGERGTIHGKLREMKKGKGRDEAILAMWTQAPRSGNLKYKLICNGAPMGKSAEVTGGKTIYLLQRTKKGGPDCPSTSGSNI